MTINTNSKYAKHLIKIGLYLISFKSITGNNKIGKSGPKKKYSLINPFPVLIDMYCNSILPVMSFEKFLWIIELNFNPYSLKNYCTQK